MDYAEAVEKAPPGWRHFRIEDVARLPDGVRQREMARIPEHETEERMVRALFWTFVYHLEPEKWDELSRYEPIHPQLISLLPKHVSTALDVGAGSGRLTKHLSQRSGEVIAVEPSAGLRAILSVVVPRVRVVDAWAESLPIPDGWSQLTAACGALGPEPEIITELQRVTATGGWIALISPEEPERFVSMGWRRTSANPIPVPPHPSWLDEFFGPLDPPHEMVMVSVG